MNPHSSVNLILSTAGTWVSTTGTYIYNTIALALQQLSQKATTFQWHASIPISNPFTSLWNWLLQRNHAIALALAIVATFASVAFLNLTSAFTMLFSFIPQTVFANTVSSALSFTFSIAKTNSLTWLLTKSIVAIFQLNASCTSAVSLLIHGAIIITLIIIIIRFATMTAHDSITLALQTVGVWSSQAGTYIHGTIAVIFQQIAEKAQTFQWQSAIPTKYSLTSLWQNAMQRLHQIQVSFATTISHFATWLSNHIIPVTIQQATEKAITYNWQSLIPLNYTVSSLWQNFVQRLHQIQVNFAMANNRLTNWLSNHNIPLTLTLNSKTIIAMITIILAFFGEILLTHTLASAPLYQWNPFKGISLIFTPTSYIPLLDLLQQFHDIGFVEGAIIASVIVGSMLFSILLMRRRNDSGTFESS